MVRALNPNEVYEWVLPDERDLPADDPDRTCWELRPLPAKHVRSLQSRLMRLDTSNTDGMGDLFADAVQLALRGWRNFADSEGIAIEFETDTRQIHGSKERVLRSEVFEKIPPQAVTQIAQHVLERNVALNGAERKNS